MQQNQFIFEGLDRIDQVIMHLESEVAYFILRDRNLPGKDGYIGRLDFEPKVVAPYVERDLERPRRPTGRSAPSGAPTSSNQELEELDAELLMDDDSPPDDDFPSDDDSPPDDDVPDDDMPDDEDEQPGGSLRAGIVPLPAELDRPTMLQGVCNWVRAFAIAHVQTNEAAHILLRVYGPKGAKVIISCSFFVRNRFFNRILAERAVRAANEAEARKQAASSGQGAEGGGGGGTVSSAPSGSLVPYATHAGVPAPASQPTYLPPPGMLLYPAHFQDGTLFGTQGAFRALNESYESFGRTMVGGISQIQNMMGQVLQDMGQELHCARSQVNHLVDSVLDHRVQQVEAQSQVQETTHLADQRTALARDAIQQIGEAAKALLLSRGLSAESAELVSTLSSHPELMSTLQEPEVQELLSDPRNLDVLARSLRQVGQQHQAMKAAAEQGGTGTPSQAHAPAGPTAMPGPGGQYALPGGVQPAMLPGATGQPTASATGGAGYPGAQAAGGSSYPGVQTGGGSSYPAVQAAGGSSYLTTQSAGGACYPAAVQAAGGLQTSPGAQVAVSPGLAARAAARSPYNSSIPAGYHGSVQAPMAHAQHWPGPVQCHSQGPVAQGFPGGGQMASGPAQYGSQGTAQSGWVGGPGSPYHPAYQPSGGHPGYQPPSDHPAFQPSGSHPGIQPPGSHPGYQPSSNPPGYQPSSGHPGFQPSSGHPGFQPSSDPAGNPPSIGHPVSPSGAYPPQAHHPPPTTRQSWSPGAHPTDPTAESSAAGQSPPGQLATQPGSRPAAPHVTRSSSSPAAPMAVARPPAVTETRPPVAAETRSRLPSSANVDPSAGAEVGAGGQDSRPGSSAPSGSKGS